MNKMPRGSNALVWSIVVIAICQVVGCRAVTPSEFLSQSALIEGLPRPQLIYDSSLELKPTQGLIYRDRWRAERWNNYEREFYSLCRMVLRSHMDRVFSGEPGDRVMRVRYSIEQGTDRGLGWTFLGFVSFATASAVNLLGVPAARHWATVDLDVSIGPDENHVIQVSGIGRAYQAYWYGYFWNDIGRITVLRATRDAADALDVELLERSSILRGRHEEADTDSEAVGLSDVPGLR
jgi:hypothetical protein